MSDLGFQPGCCIVLNVGEGDTKLTFDSSNKTERDRAKKVVLDMLRRGYALLVQVGERDGEPLYQRAKGFDSETCEYVIASHPDEEIDIGGPARDKRGRRKASTRRVPAEKAQSFAIARSAGG